MAPTCSGSADCAVKWGRATRWVLAHNPMIVDNTDTLIRTGPADVATGNYYQVVSVADGDDRRTFILTIECANMFACRPKRITADFSAAVMAP